MREIKFILSLLVLGTIILLVWYWMGGTPPTPPKTTSEPTANTYVTKIQTETAALRNAPTSTLSNELYEKIKYLIIDYHQQNLLGNNLNDRDQWKEILLKDLYTAYAIKFKDQAMYVFERSDWDVEDINVISREVRQLQSSSYLDKNSPTAVSFNKITRILAKYNEISMFVRSCKDYHYTDYTVQANFPNLSDKIQQAKAYLSNNLDDSYVNNCLRLKENLHSIPLTLFDEHVRYLRAKINENAGKYRDYSTQAEYSKNIYTPLNNQLKVLSNQVYGLAEVELFRREYEGLERLLSSFNMQATNYFISTINNQ